MSPGDMILLILTSIDRVWFFRDIPYISNPSSLDACGIDGNLSFDQKSSVLKYYQHLHDQDQAVLQLVNWLDMVNHFIKDNMIRCLVIPAFPDSHHVIDSKTRTWTSFEISHGIAKPSATSFIASSGKERWANIDFSSGGDLFSIYEKECSTPGMLLPALDKRENHLCRDNHEVLAGKVQDWICTGKSVELTGFHEGIITKEVLSIDRWYHKNIVV